MVELRYEVRGQRGGRGVGCRRALEDRLPTTMTDRTAAGNAGLTKMGNLATRCGTPCICSSRARTLTVQEVLGRSDVRTTMIYTHVLNRGALGVRSPADML